MRRATSRTRSEPLGQSAEVISTGIPRTLHSAATSSESAATNTGSISRLDAAARHTHSTIGRPAISRSTLRLRRLEARRAGITAAMRTILIQPSLSPLHGLGAFHTRRATGVRSFASQSDGTALRKETMRLQLKSRPKGFGRLQINAGSADIGAVFGAIRHDKLVARS